jgi:predicted small integral membrane protein
MITWMSCEPESRIFLLTIFLLLRISLLRISRRDINDRVGELVGITGAVGDLSII